MRLHWTSQAQQQWNEVAEYVYSEFGASALYALNDKTTQAEQSLKTFPKIGKIEPLLSNGLEYRSLVIRPCHKIIYFVQDDAIQVAAFWDTRREPQQLKEELENKDR